jgi:hypothetical protein
MKSFNQFLQESYLSEEEVVQPRLLNRRNQAYRDINNPNSGNRGYSTDPTPTPASRRLPAGAPEGPRTSPGQMDIPEPKTTKVPGSDVRGEPGKSGALATTPKPGTVANTSKSSTSVVDTRVEPVKVSDVTKDRGDVVKRPTSTPSAPVGTKSNPERINPTPTKDTPKKQAFKTKTINVAPSTSASASGGNPPELSSNSSTSERWKAALKKKERAAAGSGPSGKATPMPGSSSTGKPPKSPDAPKVPGKLGKVGKLLGPASAALDSVLSTADERSKGSGWARSLAKGATVAAGGLLGGTAGAIGGGGLLSAATGTAGALAGGAAADKAFDTVAGANAKQRKAIATANRNSQAGGAIKGVGGKTSFDTKKNTITSGGKTAQLGKTSVVTGPGGKQEVGNLAYKNGKAVYKRSDTKSLAQTSSNPLERIGRSLFAGAYKKSDAANAAKKLAAARQSDAARNKALGVKFKPGG